jgi:hypothetical protein
MSVQLEEKTGIVDPNPVGKICGFCGFVGTENTRFAGGLGVFMCEDCLRVFSDTMFDTNSTAAVLLIQLSDMDDSEMLRTLPLIESIRAQVTHFERRWVAHLHARNLSWAAIGKAIDISRQAAWERFTRQSPPPS